MSEMSPDIKIVPETIDAPAPARRKIVGALAFITLFASVAAGAVALEYRTDWRNEALMEIRDAPAAGMAAWENAGASATQYAQNFQDGLVSIRMPEIAIPEISWPSFEFPDVTLPEITIPEIDMPDIEIPEFSWPEISLPAFEWPDLEWPSVELPEIELPEIEIPQISLPEISLPEISLPAMPVIDFSGGWRSFVQGANDINTNVSGFFSALAEEAGNFLPQSAPAPDIQIAQQILHEGQALAALEPAAGLENSAAEAAAATAAAEEEEDNHYPIEEATLEVEAVLVPQKSTVISSSRDGRITAINFDNGEMFKKGDVLITYDCKDLLAELEALRFQTSLTAQKSARSAKLFKLDLISNIEQMEVENESAKAEAQAKIIEARMQSCEIHAAYDGRVTNRLANANEYTRTDRVLMEVGSLDDLEVEFLLPSRWLRWVNIGAPVTLTLGETGGSYEAEITRFHGEIDPVSQSIQVRAKLAPYEVPLLPGMSGKLMIDAERIRERGLYGFLEIPSEKKTP